eukprot:2712204-Amphidinium_carterae.1
MMRQKCEWQPPTCSHIVLSSYGQDHRNNNNNNDNNDDNNNDDDDIKQASSVSHVTHYLFAFVHMRILGTDQN